MFKNSILRIKIYLYIYINSDYQFLTTIMSRKANGRDIED